MRKKFLALTIIAILILVPIAAFAGDTSNEAANAAAEKEASEGTASDEVASKDADVSSVDVNNGTIDVNNGTIGVNNGVITTNNGTVTVNNGIILDNRGTVETNNGTIENNNGEVTINNGSLGVSAQNGAEASTEETSGDGRENDTKSGAQKDTGDNAESVVSSDEPDGVTYSVIEGNRQTWEGENDLVFLTDGRYGDFKGINYGLKDAERLHKLDESNFYAHKESDTTAITLKKSFLETLEPGDYVVSAIYEDGEATAELTVAKLDQTPATGGNAFPWIVLCAMMVSGAGVLHLCTRKAT